MVVSPLYSWSPVTNTTSGFSSSVSSEVVLGEEEHPASRIHISKAVGIFFIVIKLNFLSEACLIFKRMLFCQFSGCKEPVLIFYLIPHLFHFFRADYRSVVSE